MSSGFFISIIYVLISLLCLVFLIILGYVLFKNKISINKQRWLQYIAYLISKAVFDQEADAESDKAVLKLVKNCRFRQNLIDELIQTRKNLAGSAGIAVRELYISFGLMEDSAKKLKSLRWHIKAKGIQELSVMEQEKFVKNIFRLTNHSNELVRNEAQSGLVHFYGFRGLRFLNVTVHTLSQWQQIQLLNKLNGAIPEDMSVLKKWLLSSNESVVVFTLKLATYYNCLDLYEDVIACMKTNASTIKLQAITYLRKMPKEDTADIILAHYNAEDKQVKLLILDALQELGNESHIPFLVNQLDDTDEEILHVILNLFMILNPPGVFQSSIIKKNPAKALVHNFNNEHAA